MVRRTGKGYVLTLVGQPLYEGESGVSTSKGVIFDCEFGGKKRRIVIKCEPNLTFAVEVVNRPFLRAIGR